MRRFSFWALVLVAVIVTCALSVSTTYACGPKSSGGDPTTCAVPTDPPVNR